MGNAEFKSAFENVQSEEFDITKLNEFKEALWTEETLNEKFSSFKNLASGNDIDFYRLYKVISEVRED